MNTVVIDPAVCKGCKLCISVCPCDALHSGTVRNSMSYLVPEPDSSTCSGCGTCEYICPDMAITVIKEER